MNSTTVISFKDNESHLNVMFSPHGNMFKIVIICCLLLNEKKKKNNAHRMMVLRAQSAQNLFEGKAGEVLVSKKYLSLFAKKIRLRMTSPS